MQVVARLEIRTIQTNVLLYITSNMSNHVTIGYIDKLTSL